MNRDIWYEIMLHLDLPSIHIMEMVSKELKEIIHDKLFILNKFVLNMIKKPIEITLDFPKSYLPDRVLLKLDIHDNSLCIQHLSGIYYKILICSGDIYTLYKYSTIKYDELMGLLIHIYIYNPKLIYS